MENRFLFRGKRKDNGEWIQGYLYGIWERRYILWGMTNDIPNMVEVEPSTICKCTGGKDKNSKLIYENDIAKDDKGNLYKAFWQDKTENEALEYLKSSKRKSNMLGILPGSDIGNSIIKALEEVQQYRAIGTPEELKAAMKYVYLAKRNGTVGQVIENCVKYEEIGTPEECLRNKDFLDFLADKMNPNDFETYLCLYNALEEKGCEE